MSKHCRADRTPISADEAAFIAQRTTEGVLAPKLAYEVNERFHDGTMVRTVGAIRNYRTKMGLLVGRAERDQHPVQPPPPPPEERRHRLEDDLIERFRPIATVAPSLPRATIAPTKGLEMIAGDMHFGTASKAACAVFIETARQLKPERIILNGDLPDQLAVSKYPNDARKKFTWTLQDEAAEMHEFLRELEAAVPRSTVIVETEANHSGNGTASRWWRYLSEHIAPLLALPGAEERMAYQAWWYPAWSRLQLVEHAVIADDLLVLHGDIVRKHAAYSARATMEKWASSVMHSHTHRMGGGFQSVPELPHRDAGQVRFYEIGCLCDLRPVYASAPNWTNGFAIARTDGDAYNVELVPIIRGVAVVNTLGQTVRAA